jgi:hypothetical protein
MTEIMKLAFEAASRLPADQQEELAALVFALSQDTTHQPTADEATAIAEAEAELARGERAAQRDVDAFWQRHGL